MGAPIHPIPGTAFPYLICDLDGTLCSTKWRVPFVEKTPKDWKSFYGGISRDRPNMEVMGFIKAWENNGGEILFVSGRPDTYMGETLAWLAHQAAPASPLFMRKAKDFRPDEIVKEEMLKTRLQKYAGSVALAIDDRPHLIEMWQRNGIQTWHITDPGHEPREVQHGSAP